ncbi:putative aldouronate transport system permease protein [Paenibacillus cellulosilyticus]|uniref:Putative aldouronate transport system permease protein n=1 Tax=Paenibacillus cellulosilyticus TaxID=375489 RepID=A0A2V2YS20_9BACL|nr:carbohydrate ABC transporter permease [Paenibacillus cellulosilyticus]PWW00860.1 putative aldouronate transport system permease protein [Paenibacillus cellulosilyticus]QKS47525.1 carbohydrate ABC transporter permease [Paenibacillus cellulosilyticus]
MIASKSWAGRSFDIANVLLLLCLAIVTLYPFYNIVITSFNDPTDAARGGINFWPRQFSFENYRMVFRDDNIIHAFGVTVARTLIGTATAVLFTGAFAYGVSKPELLGRRFFLMLAIVTMYFSGGIIPYYLVVAKYLHLKGHFLVYIIPNLFSVFNAILMLTFFRGLPKEMEESAKIDGANDLRIFFQLVLPVSKPVLATIALYNAVAHWNAWYDAMLFGNESLQTLQQILMQIISSNSNVSIIASSLGFGSVTAQSLKLATMVITTLPIVFVYPFVQKYFVQGVMIGSVKG